MSVQWSLICCRDTLASGSRCVRIVRTPIQVPEANGVAERFVRILRCEYLDSLLIVNARHAERAITAFIDHYNSHRPHRSLELVPPNGRTSLETWTGAQPIIVKRRDRLGASYTNTSARHEPAIEFLHLSGHT